MTDFQRHNQCPDSEPACDTKRRKLRCSKSVSILTIAYKDIEAGEQLRISIEAALRVAEQSATVLSLVDSLKAHFS